MSIACERAFPKLFISVGTCLIPPWLRTWWCNHDLTRSPFDHRSDSECIAKARSIDEEKRIAISKAQSGGVPAHLVTGAAVPAPEPAQPPKVAAPAPEPPKAAAPAPEPPKAAAAAPKAPAAPAAAAAAGDDDEGVWTPEEQVRTLVNQSCNSVRQSAWAAVLIDVLCCVVCVRTFLFACLSCSAAKIARCAGEAPRNDGEV